MHDNAAQIEFRCQGCSSLFRVAATLAGRKGRCRKCGRDILIPAAPAPVASAAPPATPSAPKIPMRLRRRRADAEAMRQAFGGTGPIRLVDAVGDPAETYRLEYRIKGLAPGDADQPVPRDQHLVQIELTSDYPRLSPKCTILTPVFHPNIGDGVICVGDHWTAGERLPDLAHRIGEIIAYQAYNIQSPLDGEAAMWADLNQSKLPIDPTPLYAEVEGSSGEGPG